MEERWLKLKYIHQQMLSGCDLEIFDYNKSKPLAPMLNILLSLNIQSCEKFPSRCLHCHQLLALTVLKMMFDKPQSSSWSPQCLIEVMFCREQSVLVKCMFSDDEYVCHASLKVVLSWLKSNFSSEKQKLQLLNNIAESINIEDFHQSEALDSSHNNIHQSEALDSSHHNIHQLQIVLELLTRAMSKQNGQKLNCACFSVLKENLPNIFTIVKLHSGQQNLQYNFYSLLQKLTKFIYQQPTDVELLFPIFGDLIEELVHSLFTELELKMKIVSRKHLDFFNTLMCYCERLILEKQVNIFYVKFSKMFLDLLSVNELIVETCSLGFMGQLIPNTPCDLPLLRRMILLTFKVFAVMLKNNVDVQNDDIICIMSRSVKCFNSCLKSTSVEDCNVDWLPLVFEDQDDSYIECLLCLLDVFSTINKREPNSSVLDIWNPYPKFFQFLETTDYDSSIVLDWLVSPETCFLLYISRFLKLVVNDWLAFVMSCHLRYSEHGSCVSLEINSINNKESDVVVLVDSSENDVEWKMECSSTSQDNNTTSKRIIPLKSSELTRDQASISVEIVSDGSKLIVSTVSSGLSALLAYSDSDEETEKFIDKSNSGIKDQSAEFIDSSTISQSNSSTINQSNSSTMNQSNSSTINQSNSSTMNQSNSSTINQSNSSTMNQSNSSTMNQSNSSTMNQSTRFTDSRKRLCEMKCLDRVMSVFVRVRIQIERLVDQGLFPYNPAPLLSLFTQCEDLYES